MKIELRTLSYALIGSGEGSALIDSDMVFDDYGFPFIPGRRIKGLLKESAIEIGEFLLIDVSPLIKELFGDYGFSKGKIHIPNLYLKDYSKIKEEINGINMSQFLSGESIRRYFTEVIQQTAIEDKGIRKGVSKEHSLRIYRVLKPDMSFEGEIDKVELNDKEKALLFLSCVNMKRMGTRRNRGFGLVDLNFDVGIQNADKAIEMLRNSTEVMKEQTKTVIQSPDETTSQSDKTKLPFVIKTLSPLLIAKQRGDQNNVGTEEYIPSTVARGIFANLFIEKSGINNAHENKFFYDSFLKGNVLITPAYPYDEENEFYPAPFNLQKLKGKKDEEAKNIFYERKTEEKTKPLEGFICIKGDNYKKAKIYKTIYFHNTRDRLMGHSAGEGIFYYESINQGQKFKGYLIGNKNDLERIKNNLGKNFEIRTGRSKTAQYGKVGIEFKDFEEITAEKTDINNAFTITAVSPLILYNKCCFPDISVKNLEEYLRAAIDCSNLEIENAVARIDFVENFVGIWKCKTPRDYAFSEGSTFKVKTNGKYDADKLKNLEIYGLGERKEFGFGRIKINYGSKETYLIQSEKENQENLNFEVSNEHLKDIIKFLLKEKVLTITKDIATEEVKHYKNTITNNLIGRLEGMVSECPDKNKFTEQLKHLEKKQAGEKLKEFKLWDRLEEWNKNDIENKFNKSAEKVLGDKVGFKIDGLENNLWKTYWLTFFRIMRKLNKEKKNERKSS